MTSTQKLVALTAVRRVSERSAATVHEEMRRGVGVLRAIAVTAPLVGVLGTLIGIVNAYSGGMVGEKSALLAMVVWSLSKALVSTASGLLVALLAYCSHEYLANRVESIDREMQGATLQLMNELTSARFL